ncbi:uncharacterized protein IL334_001390 [Kwoniella shivajii]|uniref:DNA-directed RNA polymerase III subunit n=1 Tax=Kwoniella shivajii TaxID=564305 RepID=A0ABZ1CRY5_9TREE|nr:hypothetical protein IL334_001390 [Kwoniella shivajii]
MSRGGFRGRGRGGGGGDRGMPPGGFGTFSRQEWTDAMQNMKTDPQYKGVLYPRLEHINIAYLSGPDDLEDLAMSHSISLNSTLVTGKAIGTVEALRPAGASPAWRITGERKVVGIEIESYSDRFNPPSSSGPSKLDPVALKLDPSMFPPSLWAEYFDGAGQKAKSRPKKKRKLEDLDKDGDENAEHQETPPPSSDEDFDFDEEEEEDHQDYDANYFDNGEGDDDSGGDEAEDGGGGYDD